MKLIPIKVECHSGYKSNEYPISFYWENIKFEIIEISERWCQAQPTHTWPLADYFKVCTSGNRNYILKHVIKSDQWYLVKNYEPRIPFSYN